MQNPEAEGVRHMTIVIDTSVVLAVAANERTKPRLIEITRAAELIAPASLHWEVGNALSAMFKRKRITAEQALEILNQYRSIPLRLVDVSLDDSVLLATELSIYAYDAYIIQCARMSARPLLTLDGPLRQAAKQAGVEVLEVSL